MSLEQIVFPGTFSQALSSNLILPGSRILLREGTYSGDFVSLLEGTEQDPITIMPYPGEHAKIDGSLTIDGSHTYWKDLEIMWSGWGDRSIQASISGLVINAPKSKVINCIIHDLLVPSLWTQAVDAELYGCLIYYIGYAIYPYGHLLYTQNDTGRKLIKQNIMHNSFGWGIHAYTEEGKINNFDFIKNTCFNAGRLSGPGLDNILIGGFSNASGIVMNSNLTYGGRTGYLNFGDVTVTMDASNNRFPDGWAINNTIFTTNQNNVIGEVGNEVFLYSNEYDSNRANLTIYNQSLLESIDVDISSLGWDGQVRARNVQDYFNDIQTLSIVGGHVTVSMINRSVSTPVEWVAPATTFPEFGCFVLEKV